MNVIARVALGVALVAVLVDFQRASTRRPTAAPVMLSDDTFTYLPLAGRPLADGADDGKDCLALLPHLVTHPNWTLGIVETEWSVLGGNKDIAVINLGSNGQVFFDRIRAWGSQPNRSFYLTDDELTAIRQLNALPCEERAHPLDHARTFRVTYSYVFGGSSEYAASIPVDSKMGAKLDRILSTAAARYVPARIDAAQRIQLDMRVPRSRNATYRIRVVDGRVIVSRAGAELLRRRLTDDELVDLADWDPPREWEGGYVSGSGWARGSLVDHTRSRREVVFDSAYVASALPNLGREVDEVIDRDFSNEQN